MKPWEERDQGKCTTLPKNVWVRRSKSVTLYNYIKKRVSQSGFISFEGENYYAGEHFSHCTFGLYENEQNQVEVHYANLHLGNLAYDCEGGRFRPTAYIAHGLFIWIDD